MTTELSKKLVAIVMRNGAEIWIENEKANQLKHLLGTTKTKFVEIEDEIINSADLVGIFKAETMEDITRRKNGQWKCEYGAWHDKFEKCGCDLIVPNYAKQYQK